MKKIIFFILFSFISFITFAAPIYIEVEKDTFKLVNIYKIEYFDKYGNLIKYETATNKYETIIKYDKNGNIIKKSYNNFPESDVEYEYKNNLITKETKSDGSYVLYTYNKDGLRTSRQNINPENELEWETEFYEYDKKNNLIRIYQKGTDFEKLYEYDKNNNLIKETITKDNKIIIYEYDDKNRIIKCTSEDFSYSFYYDDEHNSEIQTTNSNNITYIKYDKNHNEIYRKLTTNNRTIEHWSVNEYWEDDKTLKKITTYENIL